MYIAPPLLPLVHSSAPKKITQSFHDNEFDSEGHLGFKKMFYVHAMTVVPVA